MSTKPRTTELTDSRALRAIAHPTRLSLLGLLRREGPLTATEAGQRLGQSAASCSFHLRQLAKYGLVEEAGGGPGRRRPWQATSFYTSWPDVADTPDQAAASTVLSKVIARRHFDHLMRWLEAKPGEPAEWQRAAQFGDTVLRVTPAELLELSGRITELIEPHVMHAADAPDTRENARLVTFLHLVFPLMNDHRNDAPE